MIGENTVKQCSVFITANTSTSYTECKKMTLIDLIDFVDDLRFYLEEKNKKINESINAK